MSPQPASANYPTSNLSESDSVSPFIRLCFACTLCLLRAVVVISDTIEQARTSFTSKIYNIAQHWILGIQDVSRPLTQSSSTQHAIQHVAFAIHPELVQEILKYDAVDESQQHGQSHQNAPSGIGLLLNIIRLCRALNVKIVSFYDPWGLLVQHQIMDKLHALTVSGAVCNDQEIEVNTCSYSRRNNENNNNSNGNHQHNESSYTNGHDLQDHRFCYSRHNGVTIWLSSDQCLQFNVMQAPCLETLTCSSPCSTKRVQKIVVHSRENKEGNVPNTGNSPASSSSTVPDNTSATSKTGLVTSDRNVHDATNSVTAVEPTRVYIMSPLQGTFALAEYAQLMVNSVMNQRAFEPLTYTNSQQSSSMFSEVTGEYSYLDRVEDKDHDTKCESYVDDGKSKMNSIGSNKSNCTLDNKLIRVSTIKESSSSCLEKNAVCISEKDITGDNIIDLLDKDPMSWMISCEPEILLLFNPKDKDPLRTTMGISPWHLRLTQLFFFDEGLHGLKKFNEDTLANILSKYLKTPKRFGR